MRLRNKILSSTALLVVMMGLITMLGIRYIVLTSLQEQLQNKGEMLTRLVAEDIANVFLDEELLAVNKSLKELVNNNDEIVYAYTIDYNRKILVHTFSDGFPVDLATINKLAPTEQVKTALLDTDNGRIRHIGYQVIPGTGIELHLGFREQKIFQAMEQINTILLMVTGFGVVGGVIISLGLSYLITKPLTRFTEQVKQFGKNKIIDQIEVTTKDEIGELACSFNELAVNLNESIAIITQSEESYRKLIEAASDAGEGIAMIKDSGINELVLWYTNEKFQTLLNCAGQSLFHKPLASIFDQEATQLILNVAEREESKESREEISFTRNDGELLYLEISASKIIYENNPAYILFCRDIRDRKLIEEEIARTNKDLSALNEIALAISGQTELEAVLQQSLVKVLELLGVELGWVTVLTKEGQWELVCGVDLNDLELKIRDQLSFVDCIKSLSAEVRDKTEPVITTGCIRGNNHLAGYEHGHLIIPLVAKSKSVGAIHALVNDQLLLDFRDRELLGNIGRQIGTAVENAMLWKELKQISSLRKEVIVKTIEAQEEERLRIARELHDETSQNISALSLASKTVELAIDNDNPEKARTLLQELRKGISLTIKGIHNIIYDLRPTLLDDKGLIPALRWLAEARLAEQGVKIDFIVAGESKRLASQLEITIFRIVQECINNTSKYAQANKVLLKLSFDHDQLVMEIADNGIGFDVDQMITAKSGKSRRGLGLIGMKERASLVGADFKIWSEPGQGTKIRFAVQTSGNGVDSIG